MLVLTRRVGEEIVISGNIRVTVLAVKRSGVRLGFNCPASVSVVRQELLARAAAAGPPAAPENGRERQGRPA
jgi:carbon storage regulator